MSLAARIAAAAAGTAGVAATGAALGVVRHRKRAIDRRAGLGPGEPPLGSLRAPARTVVATDGVPLHVEVDEPEHPDPGAPTVVFVHGYALNLDCWHFQRLALRRLDEAGAGVRAVFYDQRSHGRSGTSSDSGALLGHATIEQLGVDLRTVIDQVVPDGPIVLVGHSMGGMTVVALAEEHPEMFSPARGGRVAGVALVSTTAGGLDPSRLLLPLVPARIGGGLTHGAIRLLARGHRVVDGVRRLGRSVAAVLTDRFAFGDEVPPEYVEFVDDMLSSTPFEVVAEFFPSFRGLDKFDAVEVMGQVPTTIICGTDDRLTSIGHSRKLHDRIPGSRLVECPGAGHMVGLERHDEVDAELLELVRLAGEAQVKRA